MSLALVLAKNKNSLNSSRLPRWARIQSHNDINCINYNLTPSKKVVMKKFIKQVLIALNLLLVIVYLLGCALPWLSPQWFWLLGFMGFGFPYIVVVLIGTFIFWLFIKPQYALFVFLIIGCGYQQIHSLFAFNTNTVFNPSKAINSIRVISWNIGNLSRKTQEKNAKTHKPEEVVTAILSQNADVICLQEFADIKEGLHTPTEFISINKRYPYLYFPGWKIGPYYHRSGNVIFSKYPILITDSATFENGENIIKANIAINNDTFSFFSVHLDSYKFSKNEFEEIGGEKTTHKQNWKGIFSKVKHTLQIHNNEANIVNNFMAQTQYPSILCADMNEVPTNYVYWKIRNNKQDAFLQKGFGLGKTYNSLSAVLRIDYILPSVHFKVHQFNIIDNGLSDHKMLVADIEKL
jgi:endonuclease/exonuclease/phosphatase family metal-dependent hydrolase